MRDTFYVIGSVAGRLPDLLVACVGGGSNAMGWFLSFEIYVFYGKNHLFDYDYEHRFAEHEHEY